jgi:hypothetical protein
MTFEKDLDEYKKLFENIRESVLTSLHDSVKVKIGDHYLLNNTPLYLVMEFFVPGQETEDDYGLCLSVTYQNYDSAIGMSSYAPDHLYIWADLSRGNGEVINHYINQRIDLSITDCALLAEKAKINIISFLVSQKPILLDLLRDY